MRDYLLLPFVVLFLAASAFVPVVSPRMGTPAVTSQDVPGSNGGVGSPQPERQPAVHGLRRTPEGVLAQFFGVPLEQADTAEDLARKVCKRAGLLGYDVEAMVMTAPDPIDSHSRWQFDIVQDALQRAASHLGYVLDRFQFPDSPATGGVPPGGERRPHETAPSVILFRHTQERKLLVALLVFETATAGLHLEAFQKAVQFIHGWTKGRGQVRILGPTFSGSSPSLALGLHNMRAAGLLPSAPIRIVTGSATLSANREILERALDRVDDTKERPIEFSATVPSNEDLVLAIVRHLRSTSDLGRHRLALIFEQNTAFGQDRTRPPHDDDPDREILHKALRVGFPLHISRLRAVAERVGGGQAVRRTAPQAMQSLSLKDDRPATDQLPLFGESTGPAYVELLLANMLETLRRERITTVGLFATDTRDKLFLSQMLARHCPNIRVFTIEADLLYTHPDFSTYMRGSFVATPYPLFTANQRWTLPAEGERFRTQFPTSGTQGIYNAFHLLMGKRPATRDDLLEYSMPFGEGCPGGCAPPVWIAVNGRSGLWPIHVAAANSDYVTRVRMGDKGGRNDGDLFPERIAPLAAFLHVLVWIHLLGYLAARRQGGWLRDHLPAALVRPFGRSSGPKRYLMAAFVSLFLGLLLVDVLGLTKEWLNRSQAGEWPVVLVVFTVVGFFTLAGLLAVMADLVRQRFTAPQRVRPTQGRGWGLWISAYRAAVLGLFAASVGCLIWFLMAPLVRVAFANDDAPLHSLILLLSRSLTLANGVSPTVPILLFCAALYVWGLQHFRTRGIPPRPVLAHRLADITTLRAACIGDERIAREDHQHSAESLGTMAFVRATSFWSAVVFQTLWYVSGLNPVGVTTIDAGSFTWFYRLSSILLQSLVVVSIVQFVFVWSRARESLEQLARIDGLSGPLARAFRRLPTTLRAAGIFSPVPSIKDLELGVSLAREITPHAASPEWRSGERVAVLEQTFKAERSEDPAHTFSETQTWRLLLAFTTGAAGSVRRSDPGAAKRDCERIDELIALHVALITREVAGRLVASMTLTLTLTLLILASHTWYPAQPRQVLMGFSWACIVASALVSLWVFVQMERNQTISHVRGTRPNHVTWDLAFVSKVVVWVIVPLLSLFAAQFPETGAAILEWLKPVQSALP